MKITVQEAQRARSIIQKIGQGRVRFSKFGIWIGEGPSRKWTVNYGRTVR